MFPFHPTTHPLYIPDYMAESVKDINYAHLSAQGVRCMAFDVDSTLVSHGGIELDQATIAFLREQKRLGYIGDIVIATNRKKRNLQALAHVLEAKTVVQGHGIVRKPSLSFYQELIDESGYSADSIAMVGDKLFQDVFGANRVGMTSILVEPLGPPAWYDALFLHRWRQKRITKTFRHIEHW